MSERTNWGETFFFPFPQTTLWLHGRLAGPDLLTLISYLYVVPSETVSGFLPRNNSEPIKNYIGNKEIKFHEIMGKGGK